MTSMRIIGSTCCNVRSTLSTFVSKSRNSSFSSSVEPIFRNRQNQIQIKQRTLSKEAIADTRDEDMRKDRQHS